MSWWAMFELLDREVISEVLNKIIFNNVINFGFNKI